MYACMHVCIEAIISYAAICAHAINIYLKMYANGKIVSIDAEKEFNKKIL